MSDQPPDRPKPRLYLEAHIAVCRMLELPPDVLRLMAADILRIVNPTDRGVMFAADQLKLRLLLAEQLRAIAAGNEQLAVWQEEGWSGPLT